MGKWAYNAGIVPACGFVRIIGMYDRPDFISFSYACCKAPVDDPGGLRIPEGLTGHDVAPVAGGVADGQEDGLILLLRLPEGPGAPAPPVYRVLGVLEKVGGFFVSQAVPLRRDGSAHLFAVLPYKVVGM